MKLLSLKKNAPEVTFVIRNIKKSEKNIYDNLKIIELNILGEKGKNKYKSIFELFKNSETARRSVIELVQSGQSDKAVKIISANGPKYFNKLAEQSNELYLYAQNKADGFKKYSDETYDTFLSTIIFIGVSILSLFIFVGYYVIRRISKHMNSNDKLTNQLLLKQNELETIIREAPNPMMVHNESGKVLMVNNTWNELTGYTSEEINTIEKWTNNAYKDKKYIVKDKVNALFSLEKKFDDEYEYDVKTKDGRTIIWKFSSAPLGYIDGEKTVISTAVDITELKMKDNLILIQSRYAAMGEMISIIAHQWRQPLSVISMSVNNTLLDIELEATSKEELLENSHNILNQTEYLSNTIEDFKNFFIKDNKEEECFVEDIFQDTLKIISASLNTNFISLDIVCGDKIKIKINKRELVQVLINLITNAKDALLINRKDSNKKIEISAEEKKNTIEIRVCDNGGGIDESIIDKIFDPYFSTKKSLNGTGLGLYMCRTIVTQHLNGRISVTNTNEGASFLIELKK